MLYLVRPCEPLVWNSLPGTLVKDAVEHGSDLSKLDWEPTTDTATDDIVIGLALRHGVKASTGIILDGEVMSVRVRPTELAKSHRNVKLAQAGIPDAHHNLMEAIIPGGEAVRRRAGRQDRPRRREHVERRGGRAARRAGGARQARAGGTVDQPRRPGTAGAGPVHRMNARLNELVEGR